MTPARLVPLVAALALAGAVDLPAAAADHPADCPLTVVRAHYADRALVQGLLAWTEPWAVYHDRGYVVLGVDGAGFGRLLDAGFVVEVDEELTRKYCTAPERLPGQRAGIPGYPCYRTVEETYQAAQALVAAHPDLASLVDVGDSWDKTDPGGPAGYDLLVLKLTNAAVPGTPTGGEPPHGKPRLLLTAAIHAREYTTAELALRFAEGLVAGHGTDADSTWLLDEHEVHILLHANPDGRKHAEGGDSWRKNTNDGYCPSWVPGADLNRNFSFKWGCCGGSSTWDCAEDYRGPSSSSEPETQAVEAYARAIFPDQRGPADGDAAPSDATGVYLDLHSYQGLVLWPWGWTSTDAPNAAAMQTLGRRLAHFNGYTPQQSTDLYVTDGTTDDFAYGELGVPGLCFELGTVDFFEPCSTFESSTLPDNLDALRYLAKVVRTPYLTPAGPTVTSIAQPAAGTTVEAGVPVQVEAVVDDRPFGGSGEPTQSIAAAEVFVDQPPWREPAPAGEAMAAADGAFNAAFETVTAQVATGALAAGRHTLFVRGRDASGGWGPVSAAFFDVLDASSPIFRDGFEAGGTGAWSDVTP